MKVGIDARSLSRPLTGIGRYTLEMCRAIAKNPNLSLYLYSPIPIRADLTGIKRVTIETKNLNNRILRQLWSEIYLPKQIIKDSLDLFWGPAHRLPRRLSMNVARVVTIHDLVWKFAPKTMNIPNYLLERYYMPKAVNSADKIVADSQATANAVIKELCVAPDKLTVVSLGVRQNQPYETLSSPILHGINQPYFLFIGTLEPRKNLQNLLTAYSQLSGTLKNKVMIVIAGGKGWGGVDIPKLIQQFGLQKHVRLLGFVDELALSTLYANALFLAMPSLYEGFGLPIIEAMSYGKPVLTSNNSSMPEVAGAAGLLVDPLNIDSIRNGLEKMIGDDQFRNTLASRANDHASHFNWDVSAAKLVQVFNDAIIARKERHV